MKYPSEFPRRQRSFADINQFKASDYRNFMFYAAIPAMQGILSSSGFKHLLMYVLFIRLITQEVISNEDLADAKILIQEFCIEFEKLHGEQHLTYKLHAHLHFINQVARFGPMHKISCFPFEGNHCNHLLIK
jgi:hypothetical protein